MAVRPPSVTAEEVVRAIALHPEPVVAPADIYEDIGLSRDGARERLKSLADEGVVGQKKVGSSAMVFWLTDEGRSLLSKTDLTN